MASNSQSIFGVTSKMTEQAFVPLERETRVTVDTATAAWHLGRQPQTLRSWSSTQQGALSPLRVNGRLAWKVADLRRVLGVAS